MIKTYGAETDDLLGMMVDIWNDHPDEYFSELKESNEYKALIEKRESGE